ncbi:MAG: sodium-dependent transporter [Oliverpabstia sp.]|nr:sodium-dependent transporter [Eubacterium sp.]MCI6996703.1 sodium-dependent transporter [Eubacterium sp.]MDY2595627.1 sodium-dependent transporter [Oliverpabstia sp.]
MKKRSNFSGKLGFVLAAAGSAVGLGNLWRFPYLAARYGGGIFLLVYLILAVTFGFSLMIAEISLGRKTGLSAIGAFKKLNQKYTFIGYLASLVPIIILPYYSVIGGWVIKYFTAFISGQASAAADDLYFGTFISKPVEPVIWLAVFILATAVVVYNGVEKGIEKVSKTLMPLLVILTIGIAIYSVTLPGAGAGLIYYLKPDFQHFSMKTVVAAMGQLFYSMSLAMGIMITYGSYMKKDVNLEKSVSQIEFFDTGIAFFAGMMIVPSVFVFNGGDGAAINAGPGLMFVTLPKVFQSMPMGTLIGALFFVLVLFAALTSSISLMETIVSIVCDKTHWSRKMATVIITIYTLAIALPSSLGFGIWSHITPMGMSFLDFFDFISNSILMPIVAFLTCFFIGYVIKPTAISEEVKLNAPFRREKLFVVMIKYVAPICIIIILVSSILSALGLLVI